MLLSTIILVFMCGVSVSFQTTSTSKSSKSSLPSQRPKTDGNVESYSITPSFSYQYHTNDHGEYVNDISGTSSGTSQSRKKGTKDESNADKQIQWDDYAQASDPKFSYAASPARIDNYAPQPVPIDNHWSSLTARDSYEPQPASMSGYTSPPALLNNYAPPPMSNYEGYNGGSFDGSSGGFVGTGGGAADAPTIKGSIDYVLIPLILIGIAAPIFVVLYVVLGAFEAKLSPITTRSNTWSDVLTDSIQTLKPATDALFVTLENALHQHGCMERTMCHVGSFGNSFGLGRLAFLNKTVEAVPMREQYKRSLQILLSSMTNKPENCSAFKCP